MGLLSWLTEGIGDLSGGSMPPGMFDGGIGPQGPGDIAPPQRPMPPVQMTGEDTNAPNFNMGQMPIRPPEADGMPAPPAGASMQPDPMADGMSLPPGLGKPGLPMGTDPMTAGGLIPNGPGLAPQPPPMARPPMDAAPPSGQPPGLMMRPGLNRRSTEPVPAAMTPAEGNSIYDSYKAAGGGGPVNIVGAGGGGPQAQTALGRALGLDANRESQIRGGLAAGLKSVGDSAGKSPMQAITSSAGATLEGGKKADDKTTEQQDKYLARAIAAKREGNTAEYNKNYLRYQIESTKARLEASKEKAASGKGSVMNTPEQLYLRAIGATNQDAGIKASASKVREVQKQFGVDSKEAKAAMTEHEKMIGTVRDGHLSTLGVDPAKVKGIGEKPGFSDKNPVKDFPKDPAAAQKAFDELPDGAYFVNPKDGRLLIKRSQQPTAAAPQQVSAMTPMMPPMPPGIAPSYESESEAA
jgi:hypothetical protein